MEENKAPLPQDGSELYKLIMRGASPFWQVEAAARLVFQVETLRGWLLSNGFIERCEGQSRPYARILFSEALDRVGELNKSGRDFDAYGPGESERAVLLVAVSLVGDSQVGTLRHFMPDLEEDHAQLVAEAMMYAAGFMDATVDPWGNSPGLPGTGPNAVEHKNRNLGLD